MLAVADDKHLPVAAARDGNADAWETLFRRYQLPLYVYVYELVRDEQTALDVVQETFVNATRNLLSLRDDRKFGSWLFSIAHQKCQLYWRKPRRTEPMDDSASELAHEDPGPAELLLRAERQEDFMKLLAQLPEIHRSALLLYYLEDFSLEEISVIAGVSVGTVKSRMHYAKKALRTLLEERAV